MRILSATEAINPALECTKTILFRPFRKGTSWKVAASAYLSLMGRLFIPVPLFFFMIPGVVKYAKPLVVGGLAALGVLLTGILFVLFAIGCRFQFILFDIVLTRTRQIAPLWRRSANHTWPWTIFKLALSLAFCLLCAAPVYLVVRRILPQVKFTPGQPPSPEFFTTFFIAFAIFFVCGMAYMLVASLIGDFALPSIALENMPVTTALGRCFTFIQQEPGQICLYILLKVVISIAVLMAAQICIMILELIVIVPLAIAAALGATVLHTIGPIGHLFLVAAGVIGYLLFFTAIFYLMIGMYGALILYLQAYSMYFLGGRYSVLGDLLEPPPPPAEYSAPSPEPQGLPGYIAPA